MPARRLTLNSTIGEGLAFPGFAQLLQQMMEESFGGDLADDDSLGTDFAKMMADIPLAAVAGFSGQPPENFQKLLDLLSAERSV